MENEENTLIEEETNIEDSIEDTVEEVEETESEDDSDEVARLKAEAAKWRRLAEKKSKPQPQAEQSAKPQVQAPSLTKEEVILYAKGLTEEQVAKAKKIAELENIPLTQVPDSDLFKVIMEKEAREKKAQDSQLGASRSSAPRKAQKDFRTPGLTAEDHRAIWEAKNK